MFTYIFSRVCCSWGCTRFIANRLNVFMSYNNVHKLHQRRTLLFKKLFMCTCSSTAVINSMGLVSCLRWGSFDLHNKSVKSYEQVSFDFFTSICVVWLNGCFPLTLYVSQTKLIERPQSKGNDYGSFDVCAGLNGNSSTRNIKLWHQSKKKPFSSSSSLRHPPRQHYKSLLLLQVCTTRIHNASRNKPVSRF